MKPAPFDYLAPDSLEAALMPLAAQGGRARPLAGGQSLGPLLNLRKVSPTVIIDLGRIAGLAELRDDEDALVVGAMARQADVEHSSLSARHAPLLTAALHWVGHPAIRNRGTIGGSLAHGDPAAELPTVAIALDCELATARIDGHRTIAARDFFRAPFRTALRSDELLVSIRFPHRPPRTGYAWREFARRHRDRPIAGVAARLTLDRRGRCAAASIVLAGVGPTPRIAAAAGEVLLGSRPSAAAFEAVAAEAARACDPPSDVHGSAELRRHLVRGLTAQALTEALNSVPVRDVP